MNDAAEPDSDDDGDGYRQAELICGMLQAATQHDNAPAVVLVTVLHLLLAHTPEAALATTTEGLYEALDTQHQANVAHELQATAGEGAPAAQHQAPQCTLPGSPLGDQRRHTAASPTGRGRPPPFPWPHPNHGRPPPPDPAITTASLMHAFSALCCVLVCGSRRLALCTWPKGQGA